jgi:hypothetical protein
VNDKMRAEFEAWWEAEKTGLGPAYKFTAWNAWVSRGAAMVPMTEDQLQDWLKNVTGDYKSAFVAGVRHAEEQHGIGVKK